MENTINESNNSSNEYLNENQSIKQGDAPVKVGICTHIDSKLTNELLGDLFVSALNNPEIEYYIVDYAEDGELRNDLFQITWNSILNGNHYQIVDENNADIDIYAIDINSIKHGTDLMLQHNPVDFESIIDGSWDESIADIWFQYCSFGRVIY